MPNVLCMSSVGGGVGGSLGVITGQMLLACKGCVSSVLTNTVQRCLKLLVPVCIPASPS